jgi:sugar lactone lactonase YvrE
VLADRVSSDDPIRYANSIVVAPDGTVYFTDASMRFSPAEWGGGACRKRLRAGGYLRSSQHSRAAGARHQLVRSIENRL